MTPNNAYKIVVLGSGGCGKTTWIKQLMGEEAFDPIYNPTIGVSVNTIVNSNVRYEMWDIAEQERYSGISDDVWDGASAVIIMFDSTGKLSKKSALSWYRMTRTKNSLIPCLFVSSKNDIYSVTQVVENHAFSETIDISSKNRETLSAPLDRVFNLINCTN